jgi:tripartite-type tricarboxylate transporter receptor subunit TctC
MMGELFNQTAGVRIKHVPYRGVAPAHIPMVFISVSNAIPAMRRAASRFLGSRTPSGPAVGLGCTNRPDT